MLNPKSINPATTPNLPYRQYINSAFDFGLNSVEFTIYYYLVRLVGNERFCSPSFEEISTNCGVKSRNTARKAIESLIAKNVIKRSSMGKNYIYYLNDPSIWGDTAKQKVISVTEELLNKPLIGSIIKPGREGWVYVILAEGTNRVKFGRSNNPSVRQSVLKNQSPYPLKLLRRFHTVDAVLDEAKLHEKHVSVRVHGEWFEMEDEWIKEKLDVTSLHVEDILDYSLSWTYRLIEQQTLNFLGFHGVEQTSNVLSFHTNTLIKAFCKGYSAVETLSLGLEEVFTVNDPIPDPTAVAVKYFSFLLHAWRGSDGK